MHQCPPGVTKINEAVKIVAQIPDVQIYEVYSSFAWNFEQSTGGIIHYDDNTKDVLEIDLHVRGEKILLVTEIIRVFGEPTSVVEGWCSVMCFHGLFYKDKGMLLLRDAKSTDSIKNIMEITPETRVLEITLLPSPLPDWVSQYPLNSWRKTSMIEWKGYALYDFSGE